MVIRLMVLIFGVLALPGCTKKPLLTNDFAVFGILFGDSLARTAGASSEKHQISNCLSEKTGNDFLNMGINGETTEEALARVDAVLKAKPRLVLISLGGNDVLRNFSGLTRLSAETTQKNLSLIYDRLKAARIGVVHLGLSPPRIGSNMISVFRDARLEKIAETAKKAGVFFMPNFMTDLWTNPKLMADTLHPNDAGARVQCDRIYNFLKAEKLLY